MVFIAENSAATIAGVIRKSKQVARAVVAPPDDVVDEAPGSSCNHAVAPFFAHLEQLSWHWSAAEECRTLGHRLRSSGNGSVITSNLVAAFRRPLTERDPYELNR